MRDWFPTWGRSESPEYHELYSYDAAGGIVSVADAVKQFHAGNIESGELWQSLDALVYKGQMDRAERRSAFWNAHRQHRFPVTQWLIEQSPYFSPTHEVWNQDADAVDKADRRLSLLMKYAYSHVPIRRCSSRETNLKIGVAVGLLSAIASLYVAAIMAFAVRFNELAVVFVYITTAVLVLVVFIAVFLCKARRDGARLRREQHWLKLKAAEPV